MRTFLILKLKFVDICRIKTPACRRRSMTLLLACIVYKLSDRATMMENNPLQNVTMRDRLIGLQVLQPSLMGNKLLKLLLLHLPFKSRLQ